MRNNVNRNITTTGDRDSTVKKMQVEIKAGLYHSLKIPDKERHQYCPTNSWCKYKKGLPCPDKPHHLDSAFKEPLEKIYDRLSEPALLIRCLPGYTQNSNESINSLAWNKCPKHKWHGKKRIVMAASSASLHFGCAAAKTFEVMEKAGMSVKSHSQKEAKKRDSAKINQAELRAQEKHKKYRLARRQAKQRDEELRVSMQGVTYKAAAFDEVQLCRVGKKKKRK